MCIAISSLTPYIAQVEGSDEGDAKKASPSCGTMFLILKRRENDDEDLP
jgi:hypothetical protein